MMLMLKPEMAMMWRVPFERSAQAAFVAQQDAGQQGGLLGGEQAVESFKAALLQTVQGGPKGVALVALQARGGGER